MELWAPVVADEAEASPGTGLGTGWLASGGEGSPARAAAAEE